MCQASIWGRAHRKHLKKVHFCSAAEVHPRTRLDRPDFAAVFQFPSVPPRPSVRQQAWKRWLYAGVDPPPAISCARLLAWHTDLINTGPHLLHATAWPLIIPAVLLAPRRGTPAQTINNGATGGGAGGIESRQQTGETASAWGRLVRESLQAHGAASTAPCSFLLSVTSKLWSSSCRTTNSYLPFWRVPIAAIAPWDTVSKVMSEMWPVKPWMYLQSCSMWLHTDA